MPCQLLRAVEADSEGRKPRSQDHERQRHNDAGDGETSQPPGSNRRLCWNLDAASGKHFSGLRVPLQTLQVRSQFARTLVAQVAIFLQALVDDALQFAGHIGIQSHRSDRSTFQNGVEDQRGSFTAKGGHTRAHFVEHHTEREQIRASSSSFPCICSGDI